MEPQPGPAAEQVPNAEQNVAALNEEQAAVPKAVPAPPPVPAGIEAPDQIPHVEPNVAAPNAEPAAVPKATSEGMTSSIIIYIDHHIHRSSHHIYRSTLRNQTSIIISS